MIYDGLSPKYCIIVNKPFPLNLWKHHYVYKHYLKYYGYDEVEGFVNESG